MQYTFSTADFMREFVSDLRRTYEDAGLVGTSFPSPPTLEQDEAVARVIIGASDFWLERAATAIKELTLTGDGAFTTDDVWALLDDWKIQRPSEPRAMGGAIKTAQSNRLIKATGNYIRSTRPENHGRPVMVWVKA